jgi:hypothetical protein
MVAHYPWVLTTWRMGLAVAVMSYRNSLWFSFTGDAGTLRDVERIADFVAEDFGELRAAVATRPAKPAARAPERAIATRERTPVAAAPHGPQATDKPAASQNGRSDLAVDSADESTREEAQEGHHA